jgi:hypothetical protein
MHNTRVSVDTPTSERFTMSPRIDLAPWSSADLALFLQSGGLDAPTSALVFGELQARGVPMSSPVPQCNHAEHAVSFESGARIGLADVYAYRWEPCTAPRAVRDSR